MMKNIFLIFLYSAPVFAVSMNFSGSFRAEGNYYNKLGLGAAGMENTKTYLSSRALLQPNLIIDDHFSIKSQWNLLASSTAIPTASSVPSGNSITGQGGFVLGDTMTAALILSRVWLEWSSDFGVFKIGRMPFAWGYGLLWDAGNGLWDDFQTTLDRIEYRLHLGHVIGGLAYSKPRKGSVLGTQNDSEFYTIYLQYDNPEMDVQAGAIYERQSRSSSQSTELTTGAGNPYKLPAAIANPYPLSTQAPHPLGNNVLDVFVKKTMGYFTFGGEVGWLSGTAVDFTGNGVQDSLNALGVLLNVTYEYHSVKAFLEFLYASGDSDLTDDNLNGFVLLHRNRRPGLILGRELLGPYAGNTAGLGSLVVYGNSGTFSGVYYFRPGFRIQWSQAWASGIELIIAQKAAAAAGEARNLGVEVDVGTDYAVYKNFDLGLAFGYLFAGGGLQVPSAQGAFAVRGTAGLKFQ